MTHPKPIRGAKYLKFRCTDCGNCCTETIVPITDHDVKRLMKGTGLLAEEFIDFFEKDDFDDQGKGLGWITLEEGPRVMALRKQGEQDCCHFLRDFRCSAYHHRPITCRIYPHNLEYSSRGDVQRVWLSRSVPCPYTLDSSVDLPELVKNWHLDDDQDEEYHAKVKAFNAKHKGPRYRVDFLKYLGVAAPDAVVKAMAKAAAGKPKGKAVKAKPAPKQPTRTAKKKEAR